jgi:hypothetical protein
MSHAGVIHAQKVSTAMSRHLVWTLIDVIGGCMVALPAWPTVVSRVSKEGASIEAVLQSSK